MRQVARLDRHRLGAGRRAAVLKHQLGLDRAVRRLASGLPGTQEPLDTVMGDEGELLPAGLIDRHI